MNYMQPRQRATDKKWDYTNMNDGHVYPIGYCYAFRELDGKFYPVSEKQKEEHRRFKDKYHTGGHETYEEACECYKQYLLDHAFRIRQSSSTQHKCQVCEEWTSNGVEIDNSQIFHLCEKHSTKEEVEKLFEVGEIMSS